MQEKKRKEAERKKSLRKTAPITESKSQKNNQGIIAITTPPSEKQRSDKWTSRHLKTILFWAGVAGSLLTIYATVPPKVTIEPDFLLNEREPLSAYFRIQNAGYFSVYDVTFSCRFTIGQFHDFRTGNNRGQETEPILQPGDSATKNCSVKGLATDGPAILAFTTGFRSKFWPWRISKSWNFSAIQDSRGIFHWTHQPLPLVSR